ncbi:hypothetical protein ACU1JV_00750 [Paenibacillus sp. T2-29]
MNIDHFIQEAKVAAEKAGGFLTVELFDQFRDKKTTVTWDTFNRKTKIGFKDFLKLANIYSKDEYILVKNKKKAISNFKLINLKNGSVNRRSYEEKDYEPKWDYISEHFGIDKIAVEAGVRISGQYLNENDILMALKNTIKEIGYIPSKTDYIKLKLKPSEKSLRSKGLNWDQAMRKSKFRPEGHATKDLICNMEDCFNQFTPSEEGNVFCDSCYKKVRSGLIQKIENIRNIDELRKITKKLIWFGNNHVEIFDLYKNDTY